MATSKKVKAPAANAGVADVELLDAPSSKNGKDNHTFKGLSGNQSLDAAELLSILTEIKNGNLPPLPPPNNPKMERRKRDDLSEPGEQEE